MRSQTITYNFLFALCIFASFIFTSNTQSPINVEKYDDGLAFNLTLVAGSAYCQIDSILHNFTGSGSVADNFKQLDYEYFDHVHKYIDSYKNELKMVLYINRLTKQFVVAFEGTHGLHQLFEEFIDNSATPFNIHPVPNAQVNDYFYSHYVDTFREHLLSTLKRIQTDYPTFRIIFTGHSLGGAFATVAALDASLSKVVDSNDTRLYTFGQPRTGNLEFAKAVDAYVGTVYRVVHHKDIVPHVPPCHNSWFFGACANSEGTKDYYHAGPEVFYNSEDMKIGGQYHICDPEESDCSGQYYLVTSSTNDHLFYFGYSINCDEASAFGKGSATDTKAKVYKQFAKALLMH